MSSSALTAFLFDPVITAPKDMRVITLKKYSVSKSRPLPIFNRVHNILRLVLFLLTALAANSATSASLVVLEDIPYHVYDTDGTRFVYSPSFSALLPQLAQYTQFFHHQYEKSFDWKLDETAAFILASPRNQIANGFAQVTPNVQTVFYPSGMDLLDQFAAKSWLYILLSHETSHLYQLNPKTETPSLLKKVLGNPVSLLPLPIFLQPNTFLPTFMLEGNAVMNESRFGQGGRLYSGEIRALVYSLLREGKITMRRLINDHIDFPFTPEKYDVGGYFFEFLQNKFGVERVNHFYQKNAIHWINPLLLDRTFYDAFDEGYEQVLSEFIESHRPEFEKQKFSEQPSLITGVFVGGLNQDSKAVRFVMQTDGRSIPVLVTIDKATATPQFEKLDLELGRVFMIDGLPATVASVQDSVHTVHYSLYGENKAQYPEYNSRIVQDIRGGHQASIDAELSVVESHLYLDNKPYDITHSSVILNELGEPFYFRQQKSERVLFHSKKEIARYAGFYGKPLEALADGTVLFIGATPRGSSLYSVKDGVIERRSDSDVIIDARLLSPTTFVAVEVSAHGYDAKVLTLQRFAERPAEYHYSFEKDNDFKTFQGPLERRPRAGASPIVGQNYGELAQTRYSSTSLLATAGSQGSLEVLSIDFTDPLHDNAINATYGRGPHGENSVQTSYTNSRHRLGYGLGFLYNETFLYEDSARIDRHFDNTIYGDLTYPLFVWRRWQSQLGLEGSFEHNDSTHFPFGTYPGSRDLGLMTTFQIQNFEAYPLSFVPSELLSLVLAHKLVADADTFHSTDNQFAAHIQGSKDVGAENIFFADAGSAFSTNHNIIIDNPYALHLTPFVFTTPLSGYAARATEVKEAGAGYQKVINHGFYFTQIPLGLRRFSPFARIEYFSLRERLNYLPDRNFHVYEIGSQFELLFAHRFPFSLTVSYVGDNLARTVDGLNVSLATNLKF